MLHDHRNVLHPGARPPPSPQLLQLLFCSVISGTRSLSNPLSPGADKCYPEGVARPSIAVVVLPLACVEVGFRRIRSHPCEGHRLRSTVVYVPLKTRYTGFSSIQRGITVPEVAVPAAVLVNAKLTPSREAPPRPRTSPLKFQIGDFDRPKTKASGASSPNTPATRAYRRDHSDSMKLNRVYIRVILARNNADIGRKT